MFTLQTQFVRLVKTFKVKNLEKMHLTVARRLRKLELLACEEPYIERT